MCFGMPLLVCVSHLFQLVNQWTNSHPELDMPLKSTQCNFECAAISNNDMADTHICELRGWVYELCMGKT
jgi:hypothetical protein